LGLRLGLGLGLGLRLGRTLRLRLALRLGRAIGTRVGVRVERLRLGLIGHLRTLFDPVAVVVIAQTVVAEPVHVMRICLLAVGNHDAEIVFGVLEEILRHHTITRRRSVTGQGQVFFVNLVGSAADFALGTA
jgi:hypothetical protein